MKSRDIVIGFVFVVILIAGVLWIFKSKSVKTTGTPVATPSIEQKVNSAFPTLNVPAGADRADLNSTSGNSGIGVATRQKTGNSFSITVMANLQAPVAGFYKAELSNGTSNIVLGNMTLTKSGYLVNFVSSHDLSSYNKVIVSLGGSSVLEGSF